MILRKLKVACANALTRWLVQPVDSDTHAGLSDYEQLREQARPADVILVEGNTRLSRIIKTINTSPWTHSALYIGALDEIGDPIVHERVRQFYDGPADVPLLIEAELGIGVRISPLERYRSFHLRLCRPTGLSTHDAAIVVEEAVSRLGLAYDFRQLLDLARFLFPYPLLPRRWRSTLFETHAGEATRTICSTMMAEAFQKVHFPVLPVVRRGAGGETRLEKRNVKLFTPRDFDMSPYFDIIKYPLYPVSECAVYRDLPWCADRSDQHESTEVPVTGIATKEEV
ncbi:MAG: YiiX/YebB-like N1pC/P60 family cysteine hydrolase [Gammaproteobacteria bacterium]|jgi:hypothetical protein